MQQEVNAVAEKEVVTREDVTTHMEGSVNVDDWNKRRQSLRYVYKGGETLSAILNFVDAGGLITKVLGQDYVYNRY
jgi:hypothetical protein